MFEYNFTGVIRHFAVGNGKVFVATDSKLHQMRHDLVEEKSKDISNNTHQNAVNILLPFEANKTLITCGTSECGYCEVLDINNITHTIYRETDLPFVPHVNESSVAFLVDYTTSSSKGAYMLVGKEHNVKVDGCVVVEVAVTLRSTLQTQPGEIFSKTDDGTEATVEIPGVKWVDGFQVSSQFQSYLFANVKEKVFFLKMDNNVRKSNMTKYLKVATLHCCKDQPRKKLVSSTFFLSDSSLLWMGIFTAEHPDDPENTVLAIYNITAIRLYDPPGEFRCNPVCSEQV